MLKGQAVRHRLRLIALGAALLTWFAVVWFFSSSLHMIDERGTDLVWRLDAKSEVERRVVVVDIDDASLAALGPWPWPRPLVAKLVRQLDSYDVGLKLFDVVFPDAREGTAELAAALAVKDPLLDAPAPNVLAQVFAIRNESTLHIGQLAGALEQPGCTAAAPVATGFIANLANLHHRVGHITPVLDDDGSVRRVPAVICFGGRSYPTLALAGIGALAPSGMAPGGSVVPPIGFARQTGLWEAPWAVSLAALPGRSFALDERGQLRVPFHLQRSAFTSVSAADVIEHRVPADLLQGAWVIVGASAFGLSDAVPTALGRAVNGSVVHAQLLTALIDGGIPRPPNGAVLLQTGFVALGLLLLLSLVRGNPLRRRSAAWIPLAIVAAGAAAFLAHGALLHFAGWYVGWAAPALALVLVGGALSVVEHAGSQHAMLRLFGNLASYVPRQVAEKIALTLPSDEIQAQRSEVTLVAVDIRNFSAYVEARSPEDSARVLHRFYSTASDIVSAHGGVIAEMVGDSLMAVFNGPLPCEDHALQAVRSGREIWARCGEELPNTTGQRLEPLAICIGIETGTALIGSFGAAERRVHTVLGLTVTVAHALRDLTTDLAYPILCGPGTAQCLPPRIDEPATGLKSIGMFLLPGLRNSCKIYTLRNLLLPDGPSDRQAQDHINQQTFRA